MDARFDHNTQLGCSLLLKYNTCALEFIRILQWMGNGEQNVQGNFTGFHESRMRNKFGTHFYIVGTFSHGKAAHFSLNLYSTHKI